jgi:hypothetical protein
MEFLLSGAVLGAPRGKLHYNFSKNSSALS